MIPVEGEGLQPHSFRVAKLRNNYHSWLYIITASHLLASTLLDTNMADYQPPKSPTLLPPRKSVELEDPGARGLGIPLRSKLDSDANKLHRIR